MREKHLLLWKDAGTAMGVLEQLIAHAGACPPSQSRPQRGLRCRTGKNRKYLTILEGPVYSFKSFKSVSKKTAGRSSKEVIFSVVYYPSSRCYAVLYSLSVLLLPITICCACSVIQRGKRSLCAECMCLRVSCTTWCTHTAEAEILFVSHTQTHIHILK